jgi:hypothetical protein
MPVSTNCPKCGHHYDFPDGAAGTQRRCFRCGAQFVVAAVKRPASAAAKPGTAARPAPPKPAPAPRAEEPAEEPAAAEEPGKKPVGLIVGAAVCLVLIVVGFFFLKPAPEDDTRKKRRPDPDAVVKKDEAATVSASEEARLLEEARKLAAEARSRRVITNLQSFIPSRDTYVKVVTLHVRLQSLGTYKDGRVVFTNANLEAANQVCESARRDLETMFTAYFGKEAETASSMPDMLARFTLPEMPSLGELVRAAVMAKKPDLCREEFVGRTTTLVREGRAHEATETDRRGFAWLLERGDPAIAPLFKERPDEMLKFLAGEAGAAKRMDAELATLIEKNGDLEMFRKLATSAVFRGAGTLKAGSTIVAATEVYNVARRLWNTFGPSIDVMVHVNIIQEIVREGNRETWGDIDAVILAGRRDPKYFSQLFVKLVLMVPDQPPDAQGKLRSLDYHKHLKAALPEMTADDILTIVTTSRPWSEACLNPKGILAALGETPTPRAVPALLALYQQPGDLKTADLARVMAKCYDGKPNDALDTALYQWVSADPNVFDTLQIFVAEGKAHPVVNVLKNILVQGAGTGFERWFDLAKACIEKNKAYAPDLVSALARSYGVYPLSSTVRKQLLQKHKNEETLVDLVGVYKSAPERMREVPEFEMLLREILDKRAIKFLIWLAYDSPTKPSWALPELKRITGESTPQDAALWRSWFSRNESKLPPQIPGFDGGGHQEPPK